MRRPVKAQVSLGIISAFIVAWIATIQIGAAFALDTCASDIPSNATTLSACLGDNFPAGKDVTIGPDAGAKCTRVKVDGSRTGTKALGKITIQQWGSLYVPDQTVEIETAGIDVTGLFQAGTASCPIGTANPKNKVTITFTGPKTDCTTSCDGNHFKGIVVQKGGRLLLYGARGVPGGTPDGVSWTHLSEAAGPPDKYGDPDGHNPHNIGRPVPKDGNTMLHLAKDVATGAGAWQDGDWIAVATTSFSPFETEFVQIDKPVSKCADKTKVCMDGSTATLKQTLNKPPQLLTFYHFGGPDPGPPSSANFKAGADKNYGVDERAEVGLISRNIKLTAKIEPGDTNIHWGGEIRILNGFKDLDIQGVEIEKFGKDQLGSYPIHLHLTRDLTNTPPVINAVSVHHSFNKCVAIHSTQHVTVQNMVCARIVGHIFYQEIGDESGVSFLKNLGLGAMSHNFDINAPTDEIRTSLIKDFWWKGDNLTNDSTSPNFIGYDGFRVPNTDAVDNPTHGQCGKFFPSGEIITAGPPTCPAGKTCPPTPVSCQPQGGEQTYYTEPATGFWIINPGTVLEDNSIGGCQGEGRAYWYVPPTVPVNGVDLKFEPVGKNKNNRAHSCFAGLYDEPENFIVAEQLFPHKKIDKVLPQDAPPLIATFDQFTATRNRGRGIWIRPTWFVFTNARAATNRINVTIVTSGGLEGNAPGVWDLLKDSVIVGQSTNNVDRFGHCPTEQIPPTGDFSKGLGGKFGCIDQTPGPNFKATAIRGGDNLGTNSGGGYPVPEWNVFGYLIYDGPVRIFDNRFVNFRKDPTDANGPGGSLWTTADQEFFKTYAKNHRFASTDQDFIYEGDAALGWFDSNQSAYPTSTVGRGFHWTNVDLRHQVFTESVSRGGSGAQAATQFNDGDKNTAIIDLDGSLTGFKVRSHDLKEVKGQEPISLNNLPFNAASNSVDECLAEGAQDTFFEARPTSLISPGSLATLEFGALWPNILDPPDCAQDDQNRPRNQAKRCNHTQILTFSKDSTDFGQHQTMALHSRNKQGLWEPKVISGYGYTVTTCASKNPLGADTTCDDTKNFPNTGIPNYVSVGLTDVVKPGIDHNNQETWFFARLGICYTDANGHHPADNFTITRGYKSYAGGNVQANDPQLQIFFNNLENRLPHEVCRQLDRQDIRNTCPGGPGCPCPVPLSGEAGIDTCPDKDVIGCPARGVTVATKVKDKVVCDAPSTGGKDAFDKDACIYDRTPLTKAGSIDELTTGGKPVLDKYFYDPNTGLLYFNVIQDLPNAHGPSPLGSCSDPPDKATDDPSCPDLATESYYACPAAGCPHYVVKLNDSSYQPGRSRLSEGTTTCTPYPTYEQNPPLNQNVLVLKDVTDRPIETAEAGGKDGKFPHHVSKASQDTPICNTTTSITEDE